MEILFWLVLGATVALGIRWVRDVVRRRGMVRRRAKERSTFPRVETLRWNNFTRLPERVDPRRVAFGWRRLGELHPRLITQRLGFFFCDAEVPASARTAAGMGDQTIRNVLLPHGAQRLIAELANGDRNVDGVYGPQDVGVLTVLGAHLREYVREFRQESGAHTSRLTFEDIHIAWLAAFLGDAGKRLRTLRAALEQREDEEHNALLYWAYARACELVHSVMPDEYRTLLEWLFGQFQMLQELEQARDRFTPTAPPRQIGPVAVAEGDLEELPNDARRTLREVPCLAPLGDALRESSGRGPFGRRVDAGRPLEDRATVLEAPRVLPFGDRAGRFRVIRGEEPPPADESDDGDDVA